MINDFHHKTLNEIKLALKEPLTKGCPAELSPMVRRHKENFLNNPTQENCENLKIAINAYIEGYDAGYLRG